jgi:fructose-1,6-bisphosphatase/inositol monophosphatase family enzyme
MGAAALDLCLVAQGALDGWIDYNSHGVWDYLASTHICIEAGVHVTEWQGRSLVATNHSDRRTPIIASTPEILRQLVDVRDRHEVVRKQATA